MSIWCETLSKLCLAALRYELGDEHTYEFVEGWVECGPAPGVDTIASDGDKFFTYFDETSLASRREVLEDLDAYILSAGPFDGVLAFSMGASLGATLIVRNAQRHFDPPFRCAIFFCGGTPGDPSALARDESRLLSYAIDREVIGIPTAHIWGRNDPRNPAYGPVLNQLCRSHLRSTFVHSGGHEVPGSRDKDSLKKTAECIRNMIEKLLTYH